MAGDVMQRERASSLPTCSLVDQVKSDIGLHLGLLVTKNTSFHVPIFRSATTKGHLLVVFILGAHHHGCAN